MNQDIGQLCANALRVLSMDAVQKANSGHPGMPMGMADVAYLLWNDFLKHNPQDPQWPDRDRFVLSAGHGSMLLYSLLHLTGYGITLDEIKQFRQWGSRTAGHPEHELTPGVETTTGPLGQGIANAVGMAFVERYLATMFNRPGFEVVSHYTYVICGDGDLMEGISHEACSLAGHLKLGKLIVLYDSNGISIDGPTSLSFTEDTVKRFEAYGWQVQEADAYTPADIQQAITAAQAESVRPSMIICHSHIGYGSPNKQDSAKAHGEPLGVEEIKLTKQAMGWPETPEFYVPDEVYTHMRRAVEEGPRRQGLWEDLMKRYREAYPDLATLWDRMWSKEIPENLDGILPSFEPDEKGIATRAASGQMINALAPLVPSLLGGAADLAGSNNTAVKGAGPISGDNFEGRNIFFGVREHGMGSMMNGMALHGGIIPYGGTFLVFSDYMRPAIRMAALMGIQVIFVFTHDSIGLGEDGPTHQPIEHVHVLRTTPNLCTIRPADANETRLAWEMALKRRDGPTAIVLSRQRVPVLDRTKPFGKYGSLAPASHALRGGYVLYSSPNPEIILMSTGSEVHITLEAAKILESRGVEVRVVSMLCWELFNRQNQAYHDQVLPPHVETRMAIEASYPTGWGRHFVGPKNKRHVLGINTFGASAPYEEIYKQYGFTPQNIVAIAERLLDRVIT
ncbi:MAG: transketolase [Chloroflexaceae bacterium]|nr:transketolase [Chloroflexaceae bacterium]